MKNEVGPERVVFSFSTSRFLCRRLYEKENQWKSKTTMFCGPSLFFPPTFGSQFKNLRGTKGGRKDINFFEKTIFFHIYISFTLLAKGTKESSVQQSRGNTRYAKNKIFKEVYVRAASGPLSTLNQNIRGVDSGPGLNIILFGSSIFLLPLFSF